MLRWLSTGKFSATLVAILLLSFAVGIVDPWLSKDQQNVAANLVEESEVDAEEFRDDLFLETVFYEASQVWQPVSFWTLRLCDQPRHESQVAFVEPQMQRPPPAAVDLCI